MKFDKIYDPFVVSSHFQFDQMQKFSENVLSLKNKKKLLSEK